MRHFESDLHISHWPSTDDPEDVLFSQWPDEVPLRTSAPHRDGEDTLEVLGDAVADAWFR
jgi:hypothetical protein